MISLNDSVMDEVTSDIASATSSTESSNLSSNLCKASSNSDVTFSNGFRPISGLKLTSDSISGSILPNGFPKCFEYSGSNDDSNLKDVSLEDKGVSGSSIDVGRIDSCLVAFFISSHSSGVIDCVLPF